MKLIKKLWQGAKGVLALPKQRGLRAVLVLITAMTVGQMMATEYTTSPTGWAEPNEDIFYNEYTWLAHDNSGTYIQAQASVNSNTGKVRIVFKKNSGSFNNNITAYLYKDLKGPAHDMIAQVSVDAGGKTGYYEFSPDFTRGSYKYTWLVKSGNGVRFCTAPITVTAKTPTEEASLEIVGGNYFGTTTLQKNKSYTFTAKIKNTGSEEWYGNFFLKYDDENENWIEFFERTIGVGETYVLKKDLEKDISTIANGDYELTLYYQTDCVGNGHVIPTSGGIDNPFTVTLTSSLPTPDRPSSPSPANYATGVPITLNELSWSCGGTDFGYELYFATDPDFNNKVGGGDGDKPYSDENARGNSCPITTGTLEAGKTYYWKVGVKDPNSNNTFYWSLGDKNKYWQFTTAAAETPPTGGDLTVAQAVTYLHGKGIVDESTPSAARTDENLLRRQLAKIAFFGLYKLGGRNVNRTVPSDNYPTVYSDLGDEGDYYYKSAKALLYLEYGDGITPFDRDRLKFQPGESIRRIDVLKVLMETFNITPNASLSNPFPNDDDVKNMITKGNPKYGYIATAAQMDIIKKPTGTQNNRWRPYDFCTRGEAFIMLTRIMKQIEGNGINDPNPQNNDYFEPLNTTLANISMGAGLPMGNFQHYTKTSFALAGVAPMIFAHTYNSYNSTLPEVFFGVNSDGDTYQPLGDGWSHSYHTFLTLIDGQAIVHWGGGSIDVYQLNGSNWEPVSIGVYDTLTIGNSIEIKTKSQVTYYFNDTKNGIAYLSKIVDRNGNKVKITYQDGENSMRRITKITSSDVNGKGSRSLSFNYLSGTNLITEVSDPLGRSILFGYEQNRNTGRYQLKTFTDAERHITEYKYGNSSNVGLSKLLTRIKLPKGNIITNQYDANRRLTLTKNDESETTVSIDDISFGSSTPINSHVSVKRSSGISTYDYKFTANNVVKEMSSSDKSLNVNYTYGNSQHLQLPTKIQTNSANVSKIVYDNRGNVTQVEVTSKINSSDKLTSYYGYNPDNTLSYFKDPNGNQTNYTYDTKGNLTEIQSPVSGIAIHINDRYTNGLIKTITNPENIVTTYAYDDYGNLKTVTMPLDIITQQECDVAGRLKNFKNPLGYSYLYEYDDNDNLKKETTPKGYMTQYDYDENDNLRYITNAKGGVTTLTYDYDTDQLTSVEFGGFTKSYSYNPDGTLQCYTKPSGKNLYYDYDNLGRVTDDGINEYGYDTQTLRLTNITDKKSGETLSLGYDGFGRINSTTYKGHTNSYEYDKNGNCKKVNGTTYDYDKLNRLVKVTFNGKTINYTYKKDGRLSKVTYPGGIMTTDYGYDDAGRMTSKVTKVNGSVVASYTFDVLDKLGNIKTQTAVEPLSGILLNDENTNYTYNDNNRIITAGNINFEFDRNGNTTSRGNEIYSWDDADRLTKAGSKTIAYDPLGNITSYGNITFTTDPLGMGNVLSDSKGAQYIYGNGLEARIKNGKVSYYVTDFRGSVVAIVDENGTVTHKYQYDEYGKVTQKWPANDNDYNPFQYVGKYGVMYLTDHQYYMRARHYDPTIGRFLSEDPIWSTNLYPYADNNPIMGIDPMGLSRRIMDTSNESVGFGSLDGNMSELQNTIKSGLKGWAYDTFGWLFKKSSSDDKSEVEVQEPVTRTNNKAEGSNNGNKKIDCDKEYLDMIQDYNDFLKKGKELYIPADLPQVCVSNKKYNEFLKKNKKTIDDMRKSGYVIPQSVEQ